MDRLTVKKIVEINLEKGKQPPHINKKTTHDTYCNLIDTLDKRYKIRVTRRLSPLETPVIIIGFKFALVHPLVYCFNKNYYASNGVETIITPKFEEIISYIDKCFYK